MHTIEDYRKFLADVRAHTGVEALTPDDDGLVSVRVDDRFNMSLQFVPARDKVLCFVEVLQLQADTPKEVYRDLLAGGLFGKETAGGYFAIEPDTETVVYNYFFDFAEIAGDAQTFVDTLEKILQLCDVWVERMKAEPSRDGWEAPREEPNGNRIFA